MNTAQPARSNLIRPSSDELARVVIVPDSSKGTLILGQYFHEFWSDEAHTILLVRTSQDLQELRARQQNTYHPLGYYLIEWIAYAVGGLTLMQILNAGAVAIGCGAIMRSRSLGSATRWLLPFSFFPLFQYGAFLRSYSFLFCLVCCYALLREQKRYPVLRLALLCLLSQIHLYGLIFAFVLIALEEWRSFSPQKISPLLMLAFLVILSLAAWTVLPTRQTTRYNPGGFHSVFYVAGQSIFPSLAPLTTFNWIQSLATGVGGALYFVISYLVCRRRGWRPAAILIGSSAPVLIQSAFFYYGQRWHAGFLWVVLIYVIWIYQIERKSRFIRLVLPTLLFVQVVMGILAFSRDLLEPYSTGQEIANFLQSQVNAQRLLIGVESTPNSIGWSNELTQSVAVYLPEWKMGNPGTGEDERVFASYDKPTEHRDCNTASNELIFYMKARGLTESTLIGVSQKGLGCFTSSTQFTVRSIFVGQGGFDFGERLSAFIVSLPSPR